MDHINVKSHKVPVRSAMSDSELASIIRRERSERPEEFVLSHSGESSHATKLRNVPSVNDIIAKWL